MEYNKKLFKKNKFHQIKFEDLVNSKVATLKNYQIFLKLNLIEKC